MKDFVVIHSMVLPMAVHADEHHAKQPIVCCRGRAVTIVLTHTTTQQEDRSASFPSFECKGIHQSQSFFGVFDGHAGDRCSSYCSEEVPIRLKQTLTSKKIDVKEAFVNCFEGVDEDFCLKARHLMVNCDHAPAQQV